MVCKEDIYGWFRDSISSQRIDLMCGLLQLCLPLELRFMGSCLEDKARRDYVGLREYDLKANDPSIYLALTSELLSAESVDSLNRTLIVYLSLLRSNNSACAVHLYDLLMLLSNRVRVTTYVPNGLSIQSRFTGPNLNSATSSINVQTSADIVLLLTMASYHPAFTFTQRLQLYHVLSSFEQFHCDGSSYTVPEVVCSTRREKSCNGTNDVACQTSSSTGSLIYPTDIELKRGSKGQYYLLTMKWSDGSCNEVSKSLRQLREFHGELVKQLARKMSDIGEVEASFQLPRFPYEKSLSSIQRQTIEAIRNSFRELLKLPYSFHKEASIVYLFYEFMELSEPLQALVTSDRIESVEKTQFKPSSNLGSAKLSKDWQATTALPSNCSPDSDLTSSKTSSSLMTHRNDRISVGGSGSNSPRAGDGCAATLCGIDCGSRSRHNSPHGTHIGDVISWLKFIRLHKYTDSLSKFTFEELKLLNDDALQRLGLTSGARKKFLVEIATWKKNEDELNSSDDPGKSIFIFTRSPVLMSPVNIDSSCSEYSTPPGSPPLEHRNHFHSLAFQSSVTSRTAMSFDADKEKEHDMTSRRWQAVRVATTNSPSVDASLNNSDQVHLTDAASDSVSSHFCNEWHNSDPTLLPQIVDNPSTPGDRYSAHFSASLPESGYVTVGPLVNHANFDSYELTSNRPADYITMLPLPAQGTVPQEVPPSVVQPLPPPHPHIPPDAVLVRPRLNLISGGRAIRFQEPMTSSAISGSPMLLLPPPIAALDQSAPSGSYISVNQAHQLETPIGNSDIYGAGYFVPPSQTGHLIEESSIAMVPAFCERCGQSVPGSTGDMSRNFGCPPPSWPTSQFISVFPPPVAMHSCGIIARPPLVLDGAMPMPYRLTNPGVVPDMVLHTILRPPAPSGSPLGVVNMAIPPGMCMRTTRSMPLMCSNCGVVGHSYAECRDLTMDTILNTGQFTLDFTATELN